MPNRLQDEDSPYLRQHANNPLDWYPWCDEAFSRAKDENRPIFLSIGYSSCHWCHVMEREVFENEEIAEYLNRYFICIKVDKEERPDIDKHFQAVYNLLNKRAGGWPLSIFLTPNMQPFFAATYIPPKRKYNMIGFKELIETINKKWKSEPYNITKNAKEIEEFLKPKNRPVKAIKLDADILIEQMLKSCYENYDKLCGGFFKEPKFPHISTIDALLDIYSLTKNQDALDMALNSLKNMAKGGLYDLVDGGFCRYSTDRAWLVPHFEKMTYDNALLSQVYIKAYLITKDDFYKKIAFETIEFMQEKMSEKNLFYSASDADSEGEEGRYFIYEYGELKNSLKNAGFSEDNIKEIFSSLSISKNGSFETKNIIRNESLQEFSWWPKVKTILKAIRSKREYPFIDKKIITSWNAMMVKSLFLASQVDDSMLKQATISLESLLQAVYVDKELYHSTLINKKPKIKAFLEDYAYLSDTLLQAYQSTLSEKWLIIAQELLNRAVELFYDKGEWYFSKGEFPTKADTVDTGYPASSAIITNSLLTLGALLDDQSTRIAFKTLELNSLKIVNRPIWYSMFLKTALRFDIEDIIIKSLPNRLQNIKDTLREHPFPFFLLKSEIDPNFTVCSKRGCFASCKDKKELFEAIDKYIKHLENR